MSQENPDYTTIHTVDINSTSTIDPETESPMINSNTVNLEENESDDDNDPDNSDWTESRLRECWISSGDKCYLGKIVTSRISPERAAYITNFLVGGIFITTLIISISITVAAGNDKEHFLKTETDLCHIFECGPRILPPCPTGSSCLLEPFRNCTVLFTTKGSKANMAIRDFSGEDIPSGFFLCTLNYNGPCGLFTEQCQKFQDLGSRISEAIVITVFLNLFLMLIFASLTLISYNCYSAELANRKNM